MQIHIIRFSVVITISVLIGFWLLREKGVAPSKQTEATKADQFLSLIKGKGDWFELALSSENQSKITKPDQALSFFKKNEDRIIKVNDLLLKAPPAMRRVDPAVALKFIPNYEKFSSDDRALYVKLSAEIEDLEIQNAAVSRFPDGVISIRYILHATGHVTTTGTLLSINYITLPLAEVIKGRAWRNLKVTPTHRQNWYVIYSGK